MAISTYLADVWSATDFSDPELAGYAESHLLKDTRFGVQAMASLSLVMQLCVAVLVLSRGHDAIYLSSNLLFGLLSLHVLISAAYLKDVKTLHVLGMTFLIIGALCLTTLAHRSGELHIGLMAATVMLFVAIPLVPWALREVSVVIAMTYAMLMTSLVIVPGRFTYESLWVLQLLVLGAAVISVVVTARNTAIRKHDLRARFELENAHDEMELLTMQDHLTGAWNRRYLSERFSDLARRCADKNKVMHVAILDIDDFKGINDEFGHQFGDSILISIAVIFMRLLDKYGKLIRLGGDEFQILYCGDDLDQLIESAIQELQQQFAKSELAATRAVTVSAGIVSSEQGVPADLEALYKAADNALYSEKQRRAGRDTPVDPLVRTGTWKL